jgi:hypothetical protein
MAEIHELRAARLTPLYTTPWCRPRLWLMGAIGFNLVRWGIAGSLDRWAQTLPPERLLSYLGISTTVGLLHLAGLVLTVIGCLWTGLMATGAHFEHMDDRTARTTDSDLRKWTAVDIVLCQTAMLIIWIQWRP